MNLYIVSGISGAGKSTVLNALEDLGFYCIDNLPVTLLPAVAAELSEGAERRHFEHAAVGIDARNLALNLSDIPDILARLEETVTSTHVVFLDADDAKVITRFSETRRRHPLTRSDLPLSDAIGLERQLLEPLASRADLCIDTTHTNVHQLRELVRERVAHQTGGTMSLLFESFGFKNGVPVDADFVFDLRCLPNPHWDPDLRPLNGTDEAVAMFLDRQESAHQMYQDIAGFLERWIPAFEAENRSYMTVAVGCTGGQHRSVYMVERLSRHFRGSRSKVISRHRELS